MKYSLLASLLSLGASLVSATSDDSLLAARDDAIRRFEERYIDTLSYAYPNHTTKLIGYKKVALSPDEVLDFEVTIRKHPDSWAEFPNTYLDSHARQLRVYFPVGGALIHHDGQLIEANGMGEFEHTSIIGDCSVMGRYQTPDITGVEGNIIEDGVIFLGEPANSLRQHGTHSNIHVYDFGWKDVGMAHHHHHARSEGGVSPRSDKKSCMNNHGGPNCSDKFGIHGGRCKFNKKECVDYNGWPIKDCQGKGKKGFFGSDCFVALGLGHCWNEVM